MEGGTSEDPVAFIRRSRRGTMAMENQSPAWEGQQQPIGRGIQREQGRYKHVSMENITGSSVTNAIAEADRFSTQNAFVEHVRKCTGNVHVLRAASTDTQEPDTPDGVARRTKVEYCNKAL
jgi:hypothetical protein